MHIGREISSDKFEEAFGVIFFTAFIAALSWINAYNCRKQRKFYLNNASEVQGTVTSYNKWVNKYGRFSTTNYDIDVDADNGNTYHISTQNRKARKYRKKTDITLLVPDVSDPIPVEDISERLELEQKYMRRYNDEQKAQMMADLTYYRKEMASFIERSVIIKEDLKSIAEFVLSIFFGLLFSAASVFLIYAYFFMK